MSKTLSFVGAVPVAAEEARMAIEQRVAVPAFSATGDAVNEVVLGPVGIDNAALAEVDLIPIADIAKNGTNFVTAQIVNVTPSTPVVLAALSSEGASGNMADQYTPAALTIAGHAPVKAGDILILRLTQTTGAGKATPALTVITRWKRGG